jgi:hypothetical protein
LSALVVYDKIAESFKESNISDLHAIITASADELKADKNFGLAKQVYDAIYDNEIRKVSSAYVKISIAKMARIVALPVDQLLHRVLKLNESGDINALIDERVGMINFNRFGMEASDHGKSEVQAALRQGMTTTIALSEKFNILRKNVLTSKTYIQKALSSTGGQSVADDRYYEGMDDADM